MSSARRRGRLVLVFCGAVAAAAPAASQQELVERGNLLYQQEDYTSAIGSYEAVLTAGFESADLYYNLGNAYFKSGDLGRAILSWERALVRAPGSTDVVANLELARALTADAVEPLPRFWLFDVLRWWVELVPRGLLIGIVAFGWLTLSAGAVARILSRSPDVRRLGGRVLIAGAAIVLVLGTNLTVRELGIGQPERAVILAESVPVRSAPATDDNLTLFEVHEGTRVRVDQRAGSWAEVVLDDGKVGWIEARAMETI